MDNDIRGKIECLINVNAKTIKGSYIKDTIILLTDMADTFSLYSNYSHFNIGLNGAISQVREISDNGNVDEFPILKLDTDYITDNRANIAPIVYHRYNKSKLTPLDYGIFIRLEGDDAISKIPTKARKKQFESLLDLLQLIKTTYSLKYMYYATLDDIHSHTNQPSNRSPRKDQILLIARALQSRLNKIAVKTYKQPKHISDLKETDELLLSILGNDNLITDESESNLPQTIQHLDVSIIKASKSLSNIGIGICKLDVNIYELPDVNANILSTLGKDNTITFNAIVELDKIQWIKTLSNGYVLLDNIEIYKQL